MDHVPEVDTAHRTGSWALAARLGVVLLTAGLTALTIAQALARYHDFRTGWSWDLAYYNQWFWALTKGDGILTVRPLASYASEGPSVWKMNYLAPVRFLLAPLYALCAGPRTLLVIQGVVFWWIVPAAFTLVRSETRSDALAFSAAALVPLTPLLWPLAWNDFRELQLAIPFVLWAIQGVRGRSLGLSAIGIGGMLACRQEYAIVAATLALLPAREPEDVGRSYRWTRGLLLLGMAWFLFGFLGYLHEVVGRRAPEHYLGEFGGPKAPIGQTLETAFDLLGVGLASWAVLACLAPRAALLALPWVWGMCSGRWSLRFLGTEQWHHVRYTAPIVALVLSAGLLGYARLGARLLVVSKGRWLLAAVWALAALGCLAGLREVDARCRRIPRTIAADEVAATWRWIDQVGPEDGVLADYMVTAPLSSRRQLYSYILDPNKPKGFPRLGPEIRWLFLATGRLGLPVFLDQGFEVVHRGPSLTILRRAAGQRPEPSTDPRRRDPSQGIAVAPGP